MNRRGLSVVTTTMIILVAAIIVGTAVVISSTSLFKNNIGNDTAIQKIVTGVPIVHQLQVIRGLDNVGFEAHSVVRLDKNMAQDMSQYFVVSFVYFDAFSHHYVDHVVDLEHRGYDYVDARQPFGFSVKPLSQEYILNEKATYDATELIVGKKSILLDRYNSQNTTFYVLNDSKITLPISDQVPLDIMFAVIVQKNPIYVKGEWLLLGFNDNQPQCYYKTTFTNDTVKIFSSKPLLSGYLVNEVNNRDSTCVLLEK